MDRIYNVSRAGYNLVVNAVGLYSYDCLFQRLPKPVQRETSNKETGASENLASSLC